MRKYMLPFLITIPIMLLAWNMVDSADEPKNIYNDTIEESNQTGILQEADEIMPEEIEDMDEESDTVSSDIDRSFFKVSDISNGQGSIEQIGDKEYRVTLYDKNHNEVFSEVYSYMRMPPWFTMISGNIWEIGISVGSPARYTFYFDTETAEISDIYFNAKVFGDKYIAYMDSDVIGADEITLTLTDIFEKGILHQEVVRDFSVCADPMSAVYSVEMIDDNSIRLEYCAGEDYTTVSETIELEWTPVFNDGSVTVVAKETVYYSDGSIRSRKEYEYDSAGNQVEYISYDADGSFWYRREYEYDSAGNQVKSITYDADDSIVWRYEYEYDNAGNLMRWTEYDADGSFWYGNEYEYDSAGNKVKIIMHYNEDGTTRWYEYEYDSVGNQVKWAYYDTDGSIEWWEEYEYDSAGNRTKITDCYSERRIE